jgi:periplasmic protein TonB
MFEKLVVSSRERRSKRTVKFVLATSLFYTFSAVCAVALSVVVANPKLADINLNQTGALVLASPQPAQPEARQSATQSQASPRVDGSDPVSLADLLNDSTPAPPANLRSSRPPDIGPITGSGGIGDGVIGAIGPVGVPGYNGPTSGDADKTIGQPPEPPKPAPKPQATQADTRPVRVASTVLQGKAVERPSPAYPPLARTANVEGAVAVEIIIGLGGRVESARAISGHALLVPAAVDAARRWRFEATLLNGTPVRVTGIITFVFKLRE